MRKPELLELLKTWNIFYDKNEITVPEAKLKLKTLISENILMEVVRLANLNGHKVLFTPPHYSYLQPIEITRLKLREIWGDSTQNKLLLKMFCIEYKRNLQNLKLLKEKRKYGK